MVVAKIVGNVVLACAHPSALRNALFLCQPLDENGTEISDPIVAISPFGSKVLVSTDGSAAREYVGDPNSPIRNSIICIIDEK